MQIHDFVAIHLVDNLNACIHLLYFCSFSHAKGMLRDYKDGLRKPIRNSVLLGCLLQDSLIVCSCY